MKPITLIGIDCATQPDKTGLALGRWNNGTLAVEEITRGCPRQHLAPLIARWIFNEGTTLIALDAPLCLLAAGDFLAGRAVPPDDIAVARKEGWIWFSQII